MPRPRCSQEATAYCNLLVLGGLLVPLEGGEASFADTDGYVVQFLEDVVSEEDAPADHRGGGGGGGALLRV
jgi:hypothetical protein